MLPSQRGSWFASLLGGGHVSLTGDNHDGLQLAGSAFGVTYPAASRFSLNSVRVGPRYRARFGGLQTEIGAAAAYLTLGGKEFEIMGTASANADYFLSRSQTLSAAYQYDHIKGGSRFKDLDGWRQSVKLKDAWDSGPVSFSLAYRLELNRRQDRSIPPQFTSVSPTRHRGTADAGWKFSDAVRASLRLEYERSRYNKPDIGASGVSVTRLDQRYTGQFGLTWTLAKNWDFTGDYRYLRHPSNIAIHEYQSNRYELRIEHLFL